METCGNLSDMRYDLWDIETGNAVAFYRTATEMATMVRTLTAEYSEANADDLHLTVKDNAGAVRQKLTGSALLTWADEIQRGGGVIASTVGAISSGLGMAAKSARVAQRTGAWAVRHANRGRSTPTTPRKGQSSMKRDH